MKLPEREFRQAGTPNTISPDQASLPKMARTRAFTQSMSAGLEVLKEFDESKKKADVADSDTGAIEDLTAFTAEHGARVSYKPEELKGTDFDPGGRAEIPSHEAKPFLLEKTLRESISKRSDGIRDLKARKEWVARAELRAAKMVQQATERSIKETAKFQLDRGKLAIETAQSNGLFDEAAELIESLPIDTVFKVHLKQDNIQGKEFYRLNQIAQSSDFMAIEHEIAAIEDGKSNLTESNSAKAVSGLQKGFKRAKGQAIAVEGEGYFSVIRGNDPGEMQAVIEHLESDQYSGVLSENERFTWVNRFEGEIKSHTAQMTAYGRMQESLTVDGVQSVTKLLADGVVLDPSSVILAQKDVDELRGSSSQSALTAVARFDKSMASYGDLVAFQRSSLSEQRETLGKLQGERTPQAIAKLEQLTSAYQNNRRLLETDSMAYAENTGREVPDLPPIGSPDYPAVLSELALIDRETFETHGISSGPLRAEDVDAHADWLLQGNPQQLAMLVNEAMGRESQLFWDQLMKSGAGVQAVSGSIPFRDGQKVLAGVELRQDLKTSDLSNMKADAISLMGQAYGTSLAERRTRADAAVNHHIASLQQGQESSIESSLAAVTGGLVSFNNVTFEAPERGVTSDQVDFWVSGLTADDLPIVRQGDRDSVLLQLQNKGINLVPAGSKKYYLQRVDTGMFLTTGGEVSTRAVIQWPGVDSLDYSSGRSAVDRLGFGAL